MQYTFREAYSILNKQWKLVVRMEIKKALDISSNMQFYRIMNGETPLRADKISSVETIFKKFGVEKIWD